jgi:hypothetical protein
MFVEFSAKRPEMTNPSRPRRQNCRCTSHGKPHDPPVAAGDADPLPVSLRCEPTRPHHPPARARGVIVEVLGQQLPVGIPPPLNVNRGQLLGVRVCCTIR